MADRVEREIEEILAKLDGEAPPPPEKRPVSIADLRRQRSHVPGPETPPRPSRTPRRLNPASFLLGGAAAVIAGLVLSSFWSPLIWVSMAGIVTFLGAFAASFSKRKRTAAAPAQKGYFWRDRYIEYDPAAPSTWQKVKRRFRKP